MRRDTEAEQVADNSVQQRSQQVAEDAWTAWHPAELARRLACIDRPWCVVGGWALDLWLGRQTREHEDLEFTVLRDDLEIFRAALGGMSFHAVGDGVVTPLVDSEYVPDDIFQVWCLDPAAGCWRVDMMVEPGTPDSWVYKRDPGIQRPRRDMVAVTEAGIPYLKPAGVLLFKAKYCRPKDEADFANALPVLAASEREWLSAALMRVHPGHPWLALLQVDHSG